MICSEFGILHVMVLTFVNTKIPKNVHFMKANDWLGFNKKNFKKRRTTTGTTLLVPTTIWNINAPEVLIITKVATVSDIVMIVVNNVVASIRWIKLENGSTVKEPKLGLFVTISKDLQSPCIGQFHEVVAPKKISPTSANSETGQSEQLFGSSHILMAKPNVRLSVGPTLQSIGSFLLLMASMLLSLSELKCPLMPMSPAKMPSECVVVDPIINIDQND
ncbi:hypothetical protein BDA99DRAFT_536685 [Phascolomyces articulosus]|uniref:Uncharacterized protein n=1 Tax=Phascolomyces articulosus TaxID=60185 RepID=A0AAD5KBW9_9FUNG|nr:hypothetical protein BDA99DRAFT_536685 [Phascolomyces articulosus]